MPRYKPILERFLEKYEVNWASKCWEWQGAMVGMGYGVIGGERRSPSIYAHRFAYKQFVGPIPEGMVVRHRCDNYGCVNPEHLELGTQQENMDDMRRRGRARLLSADEAMEVRARVLGGESLSSVARDMGVHRMTVTRTLDLVSKGDFGGAGRKGSKAYVILSPGQRGVLKALLADGKSVMEVSKIMGVDRKTVRNIRDGKSTKAPNGNAKLTAETAKEVLAYWKAGFRQGEIGRAYGVSQTQVSRIVRGQAWPKVTAAAC